MRAFLRALPLTVGGGTNGGGALSVASLLLVAATSGHPNDFHVTTTGESAGLEPSMGASL